MAEMKKSHPDLLTVKSISILLCKIAKFGSYEETLEAFRRMEKEIFRKNFGVDEFNILLRAFCVERKMKEAKSVFEKLCFRFRADVKARVLFCEITKRGLMCDCGAYNALISSLVKCGDVSGAVEVMKEMEENGIEPDSVSFHSVFVGMMKAKEFGFDCVCEHYRKMKEKSLVPKTRTVVMFMKLFCLNGEVNLVLDLWKYMLEKGYCPHGHALDLLATGWCARRRGNDAFECARQTVERGRCVSERVIRMLETTLSSEDDLEKLEELKRKIQILNSLLPQPRIQLV